MGEAENRPIAKQLYICIGDTKMIRSRLEIVRLNLYTQ